MADDKLPPLAQIEALESALDERKTKKDRRKNHIQLPPEIERRSGRDRRNDK